MGTSSKVALGSGLPQPVPQTRLAREQYTGTGHGEDGDEGNWPNRLVPAYPDWDDDRQDDSTEDKPVDDAVHCEPVPHV